MTEAPRGTLPLQTIATAPAPAAGARAAGWALLLLLAAGPAAAQAPSPGLFDVTGVAADDVLNVRDAPGTRGAIVAHLAPDARGIEVVAVDATGGWGRVNAGERAGWVALRYLAARPDLWRPGALPAGLACLGTEPFWSLRPQAGRAVLAAPDAPEVTLPIAAVRDPGVPGDPRRALVAAEGPERLTAFIAPGACSDGMSERAYGLTAAVLHETAAGTRLLTGCCSLAR
jgi:uncharacterized membrane protein